MNFKTKILLLSLIFVSASCNLFSKAPVGGIIKTTNGGQDWLATNKYKDSSSASMQSVNVAKIDFDPQNHQTLILGSYNGGLYKSEDSGGAWSKILSKISVYDFAINPGDSKIIYASGIYNDHGKILKTLDGGASWQEIYNDAGTSNAVRSLALNPQNYNQILMGMSTGNIILSSDGGISWKLIKNFEDKVNKVLWQNGNIYVLLKAKGLQKSTDLGQNFTNLNESLNKTYGIANLGYNQTGIDTYSQVYIDFISPSLIYLTTNKGLYKTTDEGKNWTLAALPVKNDQPGAKAIAVGKNSSNLVLTSVGATIYKSTDGAQTFQTQSVVADGFVNYILIDQQTPKTIYGGIYIQQDN